jgi:hypothetical protein
MAITHPTYNDITQWKKIPLSSIVIHTGLTADSVGEVTYENLDESSTFSFRPVLTENDTGGQSIVAWMIEVEAIVLQNNYADMLPTLQAFSKAMITDIDLNFEAENDDVGGEQLWITVDETAGETLDVHDINLTWSINYDAYPGPKLTISIREVCSVDMISMSANEIFTQYWSS